MTKTAKTAAKTLAAREHDATAAAAATRDTPPVAALGTLAEIADQPPLFALALGTLALGAITRRAPLVRTGARMLAAEAIATAIKTAVKRSVDRSRPATALKTGAPELSHGRGAGDTAFNSFPSGHTAGAVATAQAIAEDYPRAGAAARLAAGAIGAVQLPRGKHYLTDVAAGWAIGWVAERVADVVVARAEQAWTRQRRGDGEIEAAAHPS